MREKELYGHGLTIKEISEQCNYTKEYVSRALIKNKHYTVTFDVKMAYSYKQRGYKVIVWGGLYENVLVFVFQKKRVNVRSLPF